MFFHISFIFSRNYLIHWKKKRKWEKGAHNAHTHTFSIAITHTYNDWKFIDSIHLMTIWMLLMGDFSIKSSNWLWDRYFYVYRGNHSLENWRGNCLPFLQLKWEKPFTSWIYIWIVEKMKNNWNTNRFWTPLHAKKKLITIYYNRW